jgi:hypothetical protein
MLAHLPPDASFVSLALTSKEASPQAAATVARHLPAALAQGVQPDLKPLLQAGRRSALVAIGDVLWSLGEDIPSAHVSAFLDALVPALDFALKNAGTSPLDGYIAVAFAKGGCRAKGGPAYGAGEMLCFVLQDC